MKKTELHGFRIYRQEPLPENFKRVIHQQLHQSLLLCSRFSEAPDLATHEIRKSTKRIRAIYRLFRQAIGEEYYRHGKDFCNNLNHILANHRISIVHIETLQLLSTEKKLQTDIFFLKELITTLEKHHKKLTASLFQKQRTDKSLSGIITTEIRSVAAMPVISDDFRLLASGIRKTYNRGKKCLDQVNHEPTTENFHEFRKTAKSLWNQLILLRPVWPAYIGLTVHHLDMLAQRLGLEHDLAELEQFIVTMSPENDPGHTEVLRDTISIKRQKIQKNLKPLALRLFIEKPARIAGKVEVLYRLFKEVN